MQAPRWTIVVAGLVLGAGLAGFAHGQGQPELNLDRAELAVKGYDVVAYADGVATQRAARIRISLEECGLAVCERRQSRALRAEPERFAPQFGGYCAWAVSRGYTADIDPEAWRIVDGKLYLNYSKRVQKMWEARRARATSRRGSPTGREC